jgi:hypothetical protein
VRARLKFFGLTLLTAVSLASLTATSTWAAGTPTDAGTAEVTARLPSASQLFVNCPAANTIPQTDGSTVIGCEFRVRLGRKVDWGVLLTKLVGTDWQVIYFLADKPALAKAHRCSTAHLGRGPSQTPRRLRAHGVNCTDARILARQSAALVFQNNLRLPGQFTKTFYPDQYSVGFVTQTYSCTGHVRIRQGNPNPYGHETARCSTKFGDGFTYTFDQGS